MSMEEILNQVQEIFIDVLDEEDIEIFPETTANDVEEWDSLNHIQLVVAIEKHFNIKFSASEIQSYSNVGEMCDGIKEKL
jgi:acyl carrier protein